MYKDIRTEHNQDQLNHGKYPQENYDMILRAIQSECIFLQKITKNTGDVFSGVEKPLQETFLP